MGIQEVKSGNRKIAKNVLFLYVRMFLVLVVSLYTSRIVLKELGALDFGLYNVVGSLIMLFSFIQGSLSTSASRFLSYEIAEGNRKKLNETFCMILNVHILFAIVIFLFVETVGIWYMKSVMVIPTSRYVAAYVVFQLSNVSAILAILVVPYRAMIVAQERMKAFAYISIFEVLIKLLIAYAISVSSIDKLILYGTLLFVLQAAVNIIYWRYCVKEIPESVFSFFWSKVKFQELFSFTGWSILSYSVAVVNQAYNLLINAFFGPEINAARAVSYQVQNNVSLFSSNFQVAINPQIVKMYATKDVDRLQELVLMSSKISFCLMLIILLPLLVNLDFVLNLWLVEVPLYSKDFIILLGISSVLSSFCNPLGVVAEAANRLKLFNLVTMPYYLALIPLSYFCLKSGLSAISIYVLYALFEFFSFFIKFVLVKKMVKISFLDEFLLFIRCSAILMVTIVYGYILITIFNKDIVGFLVKTLLSFVYCIPLIWFFILNTKEKSFILKKIRLQ